MFNQKMSNYPGGFANGVLIRGMPLHVVHPGRVFWVYNGTALLAGQRAGSNGNDGSFNAPFATLDYAIGQCTANRGDVIMVKPGHAETYSAADGFALDVAGVAVIGLGVGSLRPKFVFDTAATADCNVSAANTTLYNLVFEAGFADIVRGVQVTAANVAIINCEFTDQAADENWLTPIKATSTTDNNADGLWVEGCKWYSPDAAGLEFIEFNAQIKGLVVKNNVVVHEGTTTAVLILGATGKDLLGADIRDNFISTKIASGNLFIDSDSTASTGIVAHNRVGHADTTTTHDFGGTGMGFRMFDNLSVSTASLSGFVLPAIDVDS